MRVAELKAILANLPDDMRVLVDVDDIVSSPTDVTVVSALEEYSCAGYHDNFTDIAEFDGRRVVMIR